MSYNTPLPTNAAAAANAANQKSALDAIKVLLAQNAGKNAAALDSNDQLQPRDDAPQLSETHNQAVKYTHEAQKIYGLDPIETEQTNCYSRPRVVCGEAVCNARSDGVVGVFSYVLLALGTAGIGLSSAMYVLYLLNGTSNSVTGVPSGFNYTFLPPANSQLQWYWPFVGLFGFVAMAVWHALYIVGGSRIPAAFFFAVDASGIAANVILFFPSSGDNLLSAMIMHFTPQVLYQLISGIIMIGREPQYYHPPAKTPPVGIPMASAGVLPRAAAVPLSVAATGRKGRMYGK